MSAKSKQPKSKQPSKTAGESSLPWPREGIESIIVAIILALLFRSFEAEAFVIPTGSMAPTLQGRHKDIKCPECGYQYQSGAALRQEMGGANPVVETFCPMCRYGNGLDQSTPNERSFSGDRILVNKFAYQFGEPQRWDVIVFKYPGNAKQNYIKRLVGMPGETLRIHRGDVFSQPNGSAEFEILRKSPSKLRAMLQLVSDTNRIPQALIDVEWPKSWSDLNDSGNWKVSEDRTSYALEAADSPSWLRYRHLKPSRRDWAYIEKGNRPPDVGRRIGSLITDYYAYNDQRKQPTARLRRTMSPRYLQELRLRDEFGSLGANWVGDLALECKVRVESSGGAILLDLVEAGTHFECRIDVASGEAQLTIRGDGQFTGDEGPKPSSLNAQTIIRGPGNYQLRFSNVDDQILLWVGRTVVDWTANNQPHDGTFVTQTHRPVYSEEDPADLAPVAVGGDQAQLQFSNLRVLRDIYYVAAQSELGQRASSASDYKIPPTPIEVIRHFSSPAAWVANDLFDQRKSVEFELLQFPENPSKDQFFPMGDNNPQSKDARLWTQQDELSAYNNELVRIGHYLERELLIGKAFLVYWPHGWNVGKIPLPLIPNVFRMGRIR